MRINSINMNNYKRSQTPNFKATFDKSFKEQLKKIGEDVIDNGAVMDYRKFEDIVKRMQQLCPKSKLEMVQTYNMNLEKTAAVGIDSRVIYVKPMKGLKDMKKVVKEMEKYEEEFIKRPLRYRQLDILLGDDKNIYGSEI